MVYCTVTGRRETKRVSLAAQKCLTGWQKSTMTVQSSIKVVMIGSNCKEFIETLQIGGGTEHSGTHNDSMKEDITLHTRTAVFGNDTSLSRLAFQRGILKWILHSNTKGKDAFWMWPSLYILLTPPSLSYLSPYLPLLSLQWLHLPASPFASFTLQYVFSSHSDISLTLSTAPFCSPFFNLSVSGLTHPSPIRLAIPLMDHSVHHWGS